MPIYINKQQWILTEEFPTLVASCGGHHEDTAQRRELAKPAVGRWRSLIPLMNVINVSFLKDVFLILLVLLSFLFSGAELRGKAEWRRLCSTKLGAALGLATDSFLPADTSVAEYVGGRSPI